MIHSRRIQWFIIPAILLGLACSLIEIQTNPPPAQIATYTLVPTFTLVPPTDTPLPPTNTPISTNTVTSTSTPTPTPTASPEPVDTATLPPPTIPPATPIPTVPPPTIAPTPTEVIIIVTSAPSGVCCKTCRKGKACGDSCIPRDHDCHEPPGCACNAY